METQLTEHLIWECLYWCLCVIAGQYVLLRWSHDIRTLSLAGLSFPVGLSIFFIVDFVVGIVPLPYGQAIALLVKLVVASLVVRLALSSEVKRIFATAVCLASSLVVITALVQASLSAAVLSYDSYTYLGLAQSFFHSDFDAWNEVQRPFYGSYSPVIWMTHANAGLWGMDFLTLFHPLIAVFTLLSVLAALVPADGDYSGWGRFAIVSLMVALFAASIPQIGIHLFYVMPNTLSGLLLLSIWLLFTADLQKENNKPRQIERLGLYLLIFAFVFSRLEASLFLFLLMAILAASSSNQRSNIDAIAIAGVVSTMAFQLFIQLVGEPGETSIVGLGFSFGLVALSFVAASAAMLFVRKVPIDYHAITRLIIIMTAFGMAIALYVIDREHGQATLANFTMNLVGGAGVWHYAWISIGIIMLIALVTTDVENRDAAGPLVAMIVCGLLLILALGMIRSIPYRLGAQDSGNRMLLMVLPFALLLVGRTLDQLAIGLGWTGRSALEANRAK